LLKGYKPVKPSCLVPKQVRQTGSRSQGVSRGVIERTLLRSLPFRTKRRGSQNDPHHLRSAASKDHAARFRRMSSSLPYGRLRFVKRPRRKPIKPLISNQLHPICLMMTGCSGLPVRGLSPWVPPHSSYCFVRFPNWRGHCWS
jgi:hypothetical protein